MFSRKLYAGWGDMDFNSHMGNSGYLDKCADVRMMYFADNGYTIGDFARLRFGPVIMKDELEYQREIGLLQEITITLAAAGLAADGSRWILHSEVLRSDGKLCARITSAGGWLDLTTRRLMVPPEDLRLLMARLERTGDFVELPSSARAAS